MRLSDRDALTGRDLPVLGEMLVELSISSRVGSYDTFSSSTFWAAAVPQTAAAAASSTPIETT
jgi:hypothetical protein